MLVAKYNAGILKLNTSVGQVGRTQCNHLQHEPLIKSLFNHLHKACLPLVAQTSQEAFAVPLILSPQIQTQP